MKREYWLEIILGKLYGVKYTDGNYTFTAYEGTRDECLTWIENNS